MFLGLLQEIVMTQRHLPFVLFCTALLLPALASAASEEEMLHAFGDAARTLPSVPVQTPKPQPKPVAPKIIQKPAAQPELQTQLNHLRARYRTGKAESRSAIEERTAGKEATSEQR